MPNPEHTTVRSLRSGDERWRPFGINVGRRERSAWLNDFMDWVNHDPRLWHDARAIAKRRGESIESVILTALRRYVARHRHLLDE